MKKHFVNKALSAALLGCGLWTAGSAVAAVPDSVYLMAYNVHAGGGLNFAWSANRQVWKGIGPGHAFIKSDFGTWGPEKKMYHPNLIQMPDGTWRCVFQVNDYANQFAVAYSADLVKWRPQDYPYMEGVNSCIAPVLSYDVATAAYKVLFKTKDGGVYETVSKDFYHFSKPRKVDASVYPSVTEQALVDGQPVKGQVFKVPYAGVERMVQAVESAAYWAALNGELARDNEVRFQGLKPLEATIKIDAGRTKKISDKLIGIFFEDINYAADGGLYAELVQNRDFEYSQADVKGGNKAWKADFAWTLEGDGGTWEIRTSEPIHENNPNYAVVDVKQPGQVALLNGGFDGIPVKAGEKYDFSVFARSTSNKRGKIIVRLLDEDGKVIGEARTGKISKTWNKLTAVVEATGSAVNGRIEVIPDMEGEVNLDMVSLFPQKTFKNRKNGMRADLAQAIADIRPRFVRFPGGCVAHGNGLDNIYHWENTIGPLESRKPLRNLWGYHQTMGLGYYEYFQFCEDIGAEPLPVVAAGVCCQNSSIGGAGQMGIPMEEMPEYIESLLNLIEWANGDPSESPWAKMRAEAGHPKPFNLKYLGVGNEDLITPVFEERFTMIFKAIKEKYPEIQVVGTSGPFSEGPDYVEGWKVASKLGVPLVDEHYYQPAGWFLNNHDYYDRYDRSKPKVYLGEYATHIPGKGNNIETALLEAYHLIGCERNGDIVSMTSYAPLLAKDRRTRWRPDLIYFNNTEVKPGTSYYTQLLFGQNSGNEYIPSVLTLSDNRDDVRKRIGISVVKDSLSQDLILKIVNLLPVKVQATIDLAVLGITGKQDATKTVLSGMPDDWKARPETSPVAIGPQYRDELPAYSLTVVKLKSKP